MHGFVPTVRDGLSVVWWGLGSWVALLGALWACGRETVCLAWCPLCVIDVVVGQVREYMLNRGLPKHLQTKILYYYSNYLRCVALRRV